MFFSLILAVCRFPDPWTGLWFQSGVGDPILIQGDSISFKGTCIEAEGDKFLIQDG